jgi:hypothetical protein
MTEQENSLKKGDLVLVQPMRYCISFTEGGIENLEEEHRTKQFANVPKKITHHWSEDGFKARIVEVRMVNTSTQEAGENIEEYLLVKLFGRGRKHFTKRNNEKTKEVWVPSRLVSPCKEDKKEKKK